MKKDLDLAEFEEKAAFDENKLNMDNEKKFAEKDKILSEKKADKETETKEMEADKSFLKVLTEGCETKAQNWDQRSSKRAEELKVIAEAISVLEEGVQPNYGANKKLVDLQRAGRSFGPARAVSLLQRGSMAAQEASPSRRAVAFLAAAAKRLNSPLLSSITLKVQVQIDHFVKVRGLIKDIIATLEAQAKAEAETKSFCDKEMKAAVDKRDEMNAELEKLASETSAAEAEKAELQEAIQDLSRRDCRASEGSGGGDGAPR